MNATRFTNSIREHQNLSTILVCAAGIILNLLLGRIVTSFGLPLYLDTAGTITVAVLGGYLPGVLVGFATNIIKSIGTPSSLYYGAINVLIAFFATLIADNGWFKKIRGIIGSIFIFSLIGGGLGSLIPLFMDGLSFYSESLSGVISRYIFLDPTVSHVISSIIMDIPDKAVTVIIVLVLLRIIPEKYYHHFCFRFWLQAPIPEDYSVYEDKNRIRTNNRLLSLKAKVVLVLGLSLLSIAIIGTTISLAIYQKTVIKEHTRIAQGTANIAASVIKPDQVTGYLITGGHNPDYWALQEHIKTILFSSADIESIFLYRVQNDGYHVILEINADNTPVPVIGTVIPFDSETSAQRSFLLAGKDIDPVISSEEDGEYLTAYKPVFNDQGDCVCYVGAVVDMSHLSEIVRSFLAEMVSIFLGFFILLLVFVTWLLQYHVIFPINTITQCLDRFAVTDDSQESVDDNVKNVRRLDIRTGDEIEMLYSSICQMSLRQAEQMRNVRRLSDSTAKMQDGLIITMADMVENRDSDTGAHIQKTAAYVRIIVEGLRKKGYYSEKVTAKFISDVVRSAPLHDVGKINISDGILNKPGKLTEEEYEIMKTHTTAGKQIMEDAISTVKGENYLKEARNMAAYHHERWDGKGYPEGLHGEVIPLSARIMAVADVFDALTSPRVYKPAFPLDKALSIIEEGKGTQFDPKCVEVFMENLPEVKVILGKYNREAEGRF